MDYEKNVTLKEKSHAELSVRIKQADVQENYKNLLNKYAKELQIPGFRKGKVPVSVLETKYSSAIKGDLASDLVQDALESIFESLNEYERPLPYSYPELKDKIELNLDEDFSFTVHYDVFPKIELKDRYEFKIDIPDVSIVEEDIQKQLNLLQDRNALVVTCKNDETAKNSHIAKINYCEIDSEGNEVENSKRDDFIFTIGNSGNFYKFDNDIIGMKIGESKEITKTYPEDDENKELAGLTKKLRITLVELKYKDLPTIDDEFAQDVNEKYKTLDDLKIDIKNDIQKNVDDKIEQIKKQSFINQLLKEHEFDIPESMVQADLQSRWIMLANQFRTTPEDLEKRFGNNLEFSKQSFFQTWREDSLELLKNRVLIETLLRKNQFEVSDNELESEYADIASRLNTTIEQVKSHYSGQREKEYIIDDIKERKLFKKLYESCSISIGDKKKVSELLSQ